MSKEVLRQLVKEEHRDKKTIKGTKKEGEMGKEGRREGGFVQVIYNLWWWVSKITKVS